MLAVLSLLHHNAIAAAAPHGLREEAASTSSLHAAEMASLRQSSSKTLTPAGRRTAKTQGVSGILRRIRFSWILMTSSPSLSRATPAVNLERSVFTAFLASRLFSHLGEQDVQAVLRCEEEQRAVAIATYRRVVLQENSHAKGQHRLQPDIFRFMCKIQRCSRLQTI